MFEEEYLIENKYKVVEKIGRGGFGNVYLVTDTSPSRKRYALKVLEDVKMNEELKVGLVLGDKSPFLVKFLEVFNQKGRLMILMEYCSEGDLAKRINKEHPPSDIDIYRFIYESGMGLKTLHNAKIVHRDIKPSNFFLGEDGGLKLGDYGMAMALETLLGKSSFTAATNGYTAPEILMGKKVCTLKVDIFSLGVTLMEFILGHNPFSNPGENVNMMLALTGKPVDAALTHPHPAMELARRMIAVDPEARPTIDAVLSFSLPLTPLHALCVQALKDKKALKNLKNRELLENALERLALNNEALEIGGEK